MCLPPKANLASLKFRIACLFSSWFFFCDLYLASWPLNMSRIMISGSRYFFFPQKPNMKHQNGCWGTCSTSSLQEPRQHPQRNSAYQRVVSACQLTIQLMDSPRTRPESCKQACIRGSMSQMPIITVCICVSALCIFTPLQQQSQPLQLKEHDK